MPSQILTTIIISTLIIILALQLSEEKSVIIEYCNVILNYLKSNNVWDEVIKNGGKKSCRIAQFGALILLRRLYTDFVCPLYLIISTLGNRITLKYRYGSWGVIAGDLDLGDKELMREYAKEMIRNGMSVLILDCSVGNHDTTSSNDREKQMRNDVVQLFLEDLRQFATENKDETSKGDILDVDMLVLRDDSLQNFRSIVTAKLGGITKSGGIGILVHCFSSRQASIKKGNEYTPSYEQCGAEHFLSILHTSLPYMIFRGTGAIINICQHCTPLLDDNNEQVSNEYTKARGGAECAFYNQLIRSLYFEYGEHGIDCLAVNLNNSKRHFNATTIVQSSLQIVGEESELDPKVCSFMSMLKHFVK